MAPLNIPFTGYMTDGTTGAAYYYQAYFHKVNAGSHVSKWQDAPHQAASDGYFSFNLGDADFLVDGPASDGDIVIIAAWLGDTTRESLSLTNAVWYAVTLNSTEPYINSVSVGTVGNMTTGFNYMPSEARRLTDFVVSNISWGGTAQSGPTGGQPNPTSAIAGKWYPTQVAKTVEVFPVYRVAETDVDWKYEGGDPQNYTFAAKGAIPYDITYQYDSAPGTDETVHATATNEMGVTDSSPYETTVRVLARLPVEGLDWTAGPLTTADLITFNPDITDLDGVVATVDYSVDGGGTWIETGLGVDENWTYQFPTNGDKTIVQRIHYSDGSDDDPQQDDHDFFLTIANIDPVAAFGSEFEDVCAAEYTFTSTSTDTDGTIEFYEWVLDISDGEGGWVPIAGWSGAAVDEWTYAITTEAWHRITLTVTDNNGGTDSLSLEFEVDVTCPGPVYMASTDLWFIAAAPASTTPSQAAKLAAVPEEWRPGASKGSRAK